MFEFTGERLVPGEVNADLWNEHVSRYAFAASLCSGREHVLDAGCGTGYGSSLLGTSAESVLGIDFSAPAIEYAAREYGNAETRFAVALCEKLPVRRGSADLIVAFEVIEHLTAWRAFLEECRSTLSAEGVFVVSTPNKRQYTESRGAAGPNPFHVHEFEYAEFSAALESVFPHVRIFGQNHAGSVIFSAIGNTGATARFASPSTGPEEASFFVAVCSHRPTPALSNFVYVPESANVLRDRERHIRLLRDELDAKNNELERLQALHSALVRSHRDTIAELERNNAWAKSLDADLQESGTRILQLQGELERSNAWALSLDREARVRDDRVAQLQRELEDSQSEARAAIDRIEAELDSRTGWARGLDAELSVARLIIEERTRQAEEAQAELVRLRGTYWGKTGRALHLVRFPQ